VPISLPRSFDHVCDVSHYLQGRLGQRLLLLLTQALILVESLGSVCDPELERERLLVLDQDFLAVLLLTDLDLIMMDLDLIMMDLDLTLMDLDLTFMDLDLTLMDLDVLVHGLRMLMLGMDVVVVDLRLHKVHFSLLLDVFVECNHVDSESLKPFLALVGVEGGGVTLEVRFVGLHDCGGEEVRYAVGGWWSGGEEVRYAVGGLWSRQQKSRTLAQGENRGDLRLPRTLAQEKNPR
jgi:hypothetical protein